MSDNTVVLWPENMNATPTSPKGGSLCTGCRKDNVWFVNGKCLLDIMSYDQVYYALSRTARAKRDLYTITDDPTLWLLANNARLSMDEKIENEIIADKINDKKKTLPLYGVLKGNPDGSIF